MKTPPVVQVGTMPAAKYFSYDAELMKKSPPQIMSADQKKAAEINVRARD
jgi:hypothetical protein